MLETADAQSIEFAFAIVMYLFFAGAVSGVFEFFGRKRRARKQQPRLRGATKL